MNRQCYASAQASNRGCHAVQRGQLGEIQKENKWTQWYEAISKAAYYLIAPNIECFAHVVQSVKSNSCCTDLRQICAHAGLGLHECTRSPKQTDVQIRDESRIPGSHGGPVFIKSLISSSFSPTISIFHHSIPSNLKTFIRKFCVIFYSKWVSSSYVSERRE